MILPNLYNIDLERIEGKLSRKFQSTNAGGLDKRQREEEKHECIIFSITLPAMIATTLAIKKFENGGGAAK